MNKLEIKEQGIGNTMDILDFQDLLHCIYHRKERVLYLKRYPGANPKP
jgi:hypothetical protein